MTSAHVIGFCKGMEQGHDTVGIGVACFASFRGHDWVGLGVILMGLGWRAVWMRWERRERDEWWAEMKRRYERGTR